MRVSFSEAGFHKAVSDVLCWMGLWVWFVDQDTNRALFLIVFSLMAKLSEFVARLTNPPPIEFNVDLKGGKR